jgi:hypothetical protein
MATPKCPRTKKHMYNGTLRAAEALGRAKAARNLWNDGPEPIRTYKCEFCHRWHLTHKELRNA